MHPYIERIYAGERLDFDEAKKQLGPTFPLLYELEHTEQDPEWHAEGDVAIHTRMVIEEVQAQLQAEALDLDPWAKLVVQLGALLHDIAKPLTTVRRERQGKERVLAPRHAQRGADWLGWRILELGLPHPQTRALLELVRYHHEPKFLIIKDSPPAHFTRLMRRASMRMLYILELGDMRGRRCDDQQEQVELIELFRIAAQEYGCFDEPTALEAFISPLAHALKDEPAAFIERAIMEGLWDLEAGTIYTHGEALARSYQARARFMQVTLMCGPSASGKSTWVAQRAAQGVEVISMDELRAQLGKNASDQSQNAQVFAMAREQLKEALRAQRDVIWDSTSLRFDQREAVLQTARRYGAHTTLAISHVAPSTFEARNRARERQVPANVLQRQLDGAQWPELEEAHRTIYIDEHGQELYDSRAALTAWAHGALCGGGT